MATAIPAKKRPGRPRNAESSRVLPLRLLDSLVSQVEQYARNNGGISRNQAGKQLIEAGLAQASTVTPDGGYNPRTGEFEW